VKVAQAAGCTPSQLAIAWCLRRPEVSSVIVGASRVRHVEESVGAADLDLEPEVFERVDRALSGVTVEGV
jgi:aryl-alcohol dehydrogenase-like predicted oxidoreductase